MFLKVPELLSDTQDVCVKTPAGNLPLKQVSM